MRKSYIKLERKILYNVIFLKPKNNTKKKEKKYLIKTTTMTSSFFLFFLSSDVNNSFDSRMKIHTKRV